ncbi:Amino acid adenylation [Trichormus variabilis ATCC 29413]|uniref:Amino acid adenylation n=2 Tax=Anabaena variabilis TaxID=264691 RepID=Q3M3K6_TRIV2|nr:MULTISPECIES: non-ribosomal peptide synthetase [Nostocaceae]ABA24430.1 Amino acid adenylation [Trichormus variabilis ATCC 29413]MBC1214337.1 non-ribosomal peptide synthetase [Trichormus variabilis ARAD]MBC1256884.1 non-ribosomal peptide synthetase [Trichormus variabilis V5]MBC1269564.1 non-ribosomal peptide synthetase [Trichormus variabilis FSR]MBC1303867.1 non-ribosomal peptide synthetase [Trichormus variabilis N2B]
MEKQLRKYPHNQCIHQLFEEQVERTPDAVAVVFGKQHLTYQQLNHRANQLAQYLRTLGIGAEMLVGICLERSPEMIIGLLAILKAGGAYVPLDAGYPQERLAFMLVDTQIPVLLTQKELVKKLPNHEARVICLDTDWEIINQHTPENQNISITPDNLAYVMYTSGSTGQPKGVSVVHRGVVRLVKQTNYANFTNTEIFLQFAPISFDASTFEIWGCLLNGGKLVLYPSNTPSIDELGQVIQKYQITTIWLTAGLFHLMVDENIHALKPLRQLLAGGDVLSVSHVQKFLKTVENCQLINGYGPTENTTFTCCYHIKDPVRPDSSIPIGRPIAHTQVYILDENLQPVAMGATGELYIGGDGLARGYLHRPELTKERFIELNNSNFQSLTLYKTGDLARYLPDGNIEFLGRIDNQVKIRGFRIELGEIEREISQYPDVRENVVLAHQTATGEKRLVAYIVLHQSSSYKQEQLRNFLQQRLPDYMLPSAFMVLESLPLTANGKVDRHKLPTPSKERPQLEQVYIAPQTDLQRQLTNIWSDVLNIEPVGIDDNFFDLGATSTLIMQIAVRVQQQLGIELSVVKLFQYPTIAGLEKYLNVEQNTQQSYNQLQSRAQRQQAAASARRRHSQRGV